MNNSSLKINWFILLLNKINFYPKFLNITRGLCVKCITLEVVVLVIIKFLKKTSFILIFVISVECYNSLNLLYLDNIFFLMQISLNTIDPFTLLNFLSVTIIVLLDRFLIFYFLIYYYSIYISRTLYLIIKILPKSIKTIRALEWCNKKINKMKWGIVFNEISLNTS